VALNTITPHIRIKIIHGSHNLLGVLTWVGRMLIHFILYAHVKTHEQIMAFMNYFLSKKYHAIRTVLKSYRKIVEIVAKSISLTHTFY
jgi:hypothetical protein